MNQHINKLDVSRRSFMQGAGGLTFAFALSGTLLGRVSETYAADGARLNAWVTIGTDDTVTILCPQSEMGQGVLTALPLILAEELDADWSKVKQEFAPGNPKVYGGSHKMFPGAQGTLASVSVPAYWMPLRLSGAPARPVLLDKVAQQGEGAGSGLTTRKRKGIHPKWKRSNSYREEGEIGQK